MPQKFTVTIFYKILKGTNTESFRKIRQGQMYTVDHNFCPLLLEIITKVTRVVLQERAANAPDRKI